MITNLSKFGLLFAILGCTSSYAFAEERILPVLGEPIQPIPIDTSLDPAKVALGEALFNDPRLSKNNSLSCASCHILDAGGDDNMTVGTTMNGVPHVINTPTVFNARYNFRQHWNGAAESLPEQVDLVLRNHMEAGSNWNELLTKLSQDPVLVSSFNNIYAEGLNKDNYLDALNTFERSLITPNSRFDQYLLGNTAAITEDEKVGYQRFKEYGCISCHQGINIGGNLFQKFGLFYDYFAERGNITTADYGRINVTNKETDLHVFKVPSLRNVEVTAPYLHDGQVETLEEAVDIMGKTQLGKTISEGDIELLVTFLKTLTGEYKGQSLAAKSNAMVEADHSTNSSETPGTADDESSLTSSGGNES
jgi:cytochrome c peroxidase